MAKPKPMPQRPSCACGCGEPVTRHGNTLRWNRFLVGHAVRVQPRGEHAYRWKGGESRHQGYVSVKMPGHPRADRKGYVRRALLVAEEKIGRSLKPDEIVHHKNRKRDDDRPDNLEVLESQALHIAHHNRSIRRAKKLTAADVREIKTALALPRVKRSRDGELGPNTLRGLAKRFGVSFKTICSIHYGEYWKWVTHDSPPSVPQPDVSPVQSSPDRHPSIV